jgi:hypothetical protein
MNSQELESTAISALETLRKVLDIIKWIAMGDAGESPIVRPCVICKHGNKVIGDDPLRRGFEIMCYNQNPCPIDEAIDLLKETDKIRGLDNGVKDG